MPKKEKLMTQKEYLNHGGIQCPKCKGEDISAGTMEADGKIGWAEVSCNSCGFKWQDLWKLTGYAKE